MADKPKRYQRMSLKEQRVEAHRRANERFPVKLYRCRYCRFIVDERTRDGHIGRCQEFVKQGGTVSRGSPSDEHFDPEDG